MPAATAVTAAIVIGAVVYELGGRVLYELAVRRFTVLRALASLGKPRELQDRIKGTAVICGGSVAGLLAARICSDHFTDVLVLDPDNDALVESALASVPARPSELVEADINMGRHERTRVMQNRMIHATQVLSLRALQKLWPDFREWVACVGGVIGPADGTQIMDGLSIPSSHAYTHSRSGWDVFSISRGAYETLLRALVARTAKNVRFINGTMVGVERSEDGKRIAGAVWRGQGGEERVDTELIVDCTGAAHAGTKWLRRAGFPAPSKETYNPHMRYATLEFEVDPQVVEKIIPGGKRAYPLLIVNRENEEGRVVVMSWVEHDRIHINLGGWAFKGEINTVDDMREFTKEIGRISEIPEWLFRLYDYLAGKPSETVTSHVASAGTLYHVKYQSCSAELPGNFVALGDAHMKINPVGGLGLTKALVGAVVLDACLRRCRGGLGDGFPKGFFGQLEDKLGSIWTSKKLSDYHFTATLPAQGETLSLGSRFRTLQKWILRLEAEGDLDVARRRFEIAQWVAPHVVMITPGVLAKVGWRVGREWLRGWWDVAGR